MAPAAADPGVASANGSTTDPFDESNAIDPGEEVLGQAGTISLPDGEFVIPPQKSKDPIDRPNRPVVCDRNETWISSWKAKATKDTATSEAVIYKFPPQGTRQRFLIIDQTVGILLTTPGGIDVRALIKTARKRAMEPN